MDISAACRVCFANNVKMHRVIDTPLQELYEKLANIRLTKWWSKAGHPNELCTICYAHLQRCHSFQEAATRAEHLLAQVYLDRVTLTQDVLSMIEQPPVHNYIATSVENVNIYCGTEAREREQIKQEAEIEEDEECQDEVCKDEVHDDTEDASQVKLKLEYESEHSEPIVSAETDSDEDVPLHVLRSTQAKRRTEGEEKEKKKRAYKECKLVAREIILTYEQQKEAMSARASSLNYLNSPHRCTLCFRGFINAETYSNHMEKHLESSGEHVCQLCFMRYRSARLLRAHTHAAHSRQYVCNKCGHTSNTRHQASDHERLHSGEYYECKLCGKSFHLRTSYLTHVRCAHAGAGAGGAALVCAACGDRYVSEHGLRMHRARAHARNTHEGEGEGEGEESPESRYCAACDIQFASRRARHTHILTTPAHWTTHDTKECPICAKVIQTPMTSHMLLHEKELKRARTKPSERPEGAKLNCDQCSLSFASRARLSAHVRRVHLGLKYDKNLVCELCGKKCTSGATLRYHQRTHTGERPHACAAPACGKRFADTNQLRIHTRTHTGERPYACHHCGRRFAQKPALNRHYRVHTGAKPYTCELCTKSFSQSNSLNTHVKAVHLKMANAKKRSRSSYVRKNGSNENGSELTSTVKMDLGE